VLAAAWVGVLAALGVALDVELVDGTVDRGLDGGEMTDPLAPGGSNR